MQWEVTKNECLCSRMLSNFFAKSTSLIKEEDISKSKIGNQMAVKPCYKGRTLVVINLCRILSTLSNGSRCSLTQCNLADKKVKSANAHRKETLQQIKDYLKKNKEIDDVTISGDFNQNITSNEIQMLIRELVV